MHNLSFTKTKKRENLNVLETRAISIITVSKILNVKVCVC